PCDRGFARRKSPWRVTWEAAGRLVSCTVGGCLARRQAVRVTTGRKGGNDERRTQFAVASAVRRLGGGRPGDGHNPWLGTPRAGGRELELLHAEPGGVDLGQGPEGYLRA